MPKTMPKPKPPPPVGDSSPLDQRQADLTRQLTLARAQNAYLHRELANALTQAPMAPAEGSTEDHLRLEVEHLRQRHAMLKLHYADAQQKIAQLNYSLARVYKVLGWESGSESPGSGPGWALFGHETQLVETILTQLLTLAHPDRWSQGQPATALAHELLVAINAHREKLAQD